MQREERQTERGEVGVKLQLQLVLKQFDNDATIYNPHGQKDSQPEEQLKGGNLLLYRLFLWCKDANIFYKAI